MLGGIQLLCSHLGGRELDQSAKMHANRGDGKGLCQCERLYITF